MIFRVNDYVERKRVHGRPMKIGVVIRIDNSDEDHYVKVEYDGNFSVDYHSDSLHLLDFPLVEFI